MQTFNQGDIVKLNSGGPNMTIRSVHFDKAASLYKQQQPVGYYDCVWFETEDNTSQPLQYGTFHANELTLVKTNNNQ
jgi:uncharacterized protein YodC (DUF2158 family)